MNIYSFGITEIDMSHTQTAKKRQTAKDGKVNTNTVNNKPLHILFLCRKWTLKTDPLVVYCVQNMEILK